MPIEAIEARNVLDGRKLVEHIKSSGASSYPFGLDTLPVASANQAAQGNFRADRRDAVIASTGGALLDYLINTEHISLPVSE